MKILHLLDERWDSGLTAYGLASARAMKQRGHDVHVAARPGLSAARQAEKPWVARSSLDDSPVASTMGGKIGFDVVNAHTGAGHSWGFFAPGFRPMALGSHTRGEARQLSIRPGQGFLFRETDGVIAASKALEESYGARFPFLMDQISVIYPGIDLAHASRLVPEPSGNAGGRFGAVGPGQRASVFY
jgi:hypothetical protein